MTTLPADPQEDEPSKVVRRGYRFAILPEWVLYHPDLSDRAIRLFCVLDRYTDAEGVCYPSRKSLAEKMRCSLDTVDRAVAELGKAGAVSVEYRFVPQPGGKPKHTSNLYVLHGEPPEGGGRKSAARGKFAARGSRTDAAQNESHLELEPPVEETVAREDDDRATVAASSSEDDMSIYREAARIITDAQPEPPGNPVAFSAKVALNLSRERAALLAELREAAPGLDAQSYARWVAQDVNPFVGPFDDDGLDDLPPAFVD